MSTPILSITIATFNRRKYLEQTLKGLLPQKTSEVEILVCNNCSEDDTSVYLYSLGDAVKHLHQDSNVGLDRNFLSCIKESTGDYIWLLCDDDLPCSNAVHKIIEAIKSYKDVPMFYLRVNGQDENVSGYNDAPVETGWTKYDSDGFLNEINYMFTFAPSIIVRRDCIDLGFIEQTVGSLLLPAAVTLSTTGQYGGAVISDKPLLYARGNNSGGYNAYIVFTKNIIDLFGVCQSHWFKARTLHRTYNENLRMVLPLVIQNWDMNIKGIVTLVKFSYNYRAFYTTVVPLIIKKMLRYVMRRSVAC